MRNDLVFTAERRERCAQLDKTYMAAVIASATALATLVWTVLSYVFTRSQLDRHAKMAHEASTVANEVADNAAKAQERFAAREQWRNRFEFAIRLSLSSETAEQAEGISLIQDLKSAEWATDEDRLLALSAANRLAA